MPNSTWKATVTLTGQSPQHAQAVRIASQCMSPGGAVVRLCASSIAITFSTTPGVGSDTTAARSDVGSSCAPTGSN
eukprot:2165457-Amphidinium_carterae.1